MRLFAVILLSVFIGIFCLSADTAPQYSPLLPVKMGMMHGYIDRTGHLDIYPQYLDAYAFHEGLAYVKKAKAWGMINQDGKLVIPFRVWKIETHLNEGYVPLKLYGAYRFYDVKGDSLPGTYQWAGNFTEGLAPVQFQGKDSLQYFIDKTGKK